MPRRCDIDPVELRHLLPYLQITELVDGGARIRYRLVGTAIVNAYGAELTGKYFDEVFTPERLRFVAGNYRTMCSEKRPLLVCNRYLSARDVELFCFRLVMPLSEDEVTVHQCLSAFRFQYPGQASQWAGEWHLGKHNIDLSSAYTEIIR